MWEDGFDVPIQVEERRDPRPPSVRSQDAVILEYAVRNRLLRGWEAKAETEGIADERGAPRPGRVRRRRRRYSPPAAARAEGVYRRIAPSGQRFPLQAVALIRRLLQEGAPEEFVLEKYRMHAFACEDIGVPRMPFIPYLKELLEVFLLDRKSAAGNGFRNHSLP